MQLELYQAETARIATEQSALLAEARLIMTIRKLTALEQGGVLHALQVLIENAIGKAKQLLKANQQPVPISAYDAFTALARMGIIANVDLSAWYAILGLRNRIVHDYMNVDMRRVLEFVQSAQEEFITEFLLMEFHY